MVYVPGQKPSSSTDTAIQQVRRMTGGKSASPSTVVVAGAQGTQSPAASAPTVYVVNGGVLPPATKPNYGGAPAANNIMLGVGSVLRYAFNELSGTTCFDVSGTSNISNGGTMNFLRKSLSSGYAVRCCMDSNGNVSQTNNQFMTTGTVSTSLSTGITIAMRVYIPAQDFSHYSHIFLLYPTTNGSFFSLRPNQAGTTYLAPSWCPNDWNNHCATPSLGQNQWHTFVATYNAATGFAALYYDSVSTYVSYTYATNLGNLAAQPILLGGGDSPSYQFAADWDWFALWDRVLNSSEIAYIMTNNYWMFAAPAYKALTDTTEVKTLVDGTVFGSYVRLPDPTGRSVAGRVTVKKTDASTNPVSVLPYGNELIDGAALAPTLTAQGHSLGVYPYNGDWFIDSAV